MDFTVENAGTTIACREYAGPDVSPDAPALVCVHGACVEGVFFDGIARELACDYRVIAYDRRGCGESSDAADGRYDLAAQAADLQAVIEHIGAPTNVLAHSAGTLVTLELLRANPAIISRAILHEPAVTDEGAGLGAAPVLLEMIAAGKVSRALRAFLGAIGDSDPEAPKLTEAEAKHALRNALIPIITVLAPLIVDLMTGSLVVEKIFAIPGVGSLLVTAIQSNDYNVVISLSFIYSAMYIGIMLVVDLLYGIIDPRIRLAKGDD